MANKLDNLQNKKIVIIGLGLIGGSIARRLHAMKKGAEIIAVGRNSNVLQQAQDDGVIHGFTTDISKACINADLIVIAVPVLSIENILLELKSVVSEQTVITDVASVKKVFIDAAVNVFGELPPRFVPGHPIAGSEHSGYRASTPELFENRKVILTPQETTEEEAVSLVKSFWQLLGAEVVEMSVEKHDEILAATSHLPHLLAFGLVDTLSQQKESEEIFRYVAGGFRDFTRIASSDPQMWHDIFMVNGEATVKILDCYIKDLDRLREALLSENSDELMTTFKRAKDSRDRLLKNLPDEDS